MSVLQYASTFVNGLISKVVHPLILQENRNNHQKRVRVELLPDESRPIKRSRELEHIEKVSGQPVFPLRRFASFVDANAPNNLINRKPSSLLLSTRTQESIDSFSTYNRHIGEEGILDSLQPESTHRIVPEIAPPTPLKLETTNSFRLLSRPKYTSKEFADFVKNMDNETRKSEGVVKLPVTSFATPVGNVRTVPYGAPSAANVEQEESVGGSLKASTQMEGVSAPTAADAPLPTANSSLSLDERIAAVSSFLASFSVEEYLEQAAQRRKFIEQSLLKPTRPAPSSVEAAVKEIDLTAASSIAGKDEASVEPPLVGVVDLAAEETEDKHDVLESEEGAELAELFTQEEEPKDLVLPSYFFDHPHLSRSDFARLGAFLFSRSGKSGLPQFSAEYNADKEVGRIDSDYVRWDSLQKLYPKEWINDDVVNFVRTRVNLEAAFHALKDFPPSALPSSKLVSRDPTKQKYTSFTSSFRINPQPPAPKNRPSPANPEPVPFLDGSGAKYSRARVFSWNSYFLSQLHTPTRGYDFAGVKRWTKKNGLNIFQTDVLLFPVNIPNVHWSLAAIDVPGHSVHYYDSMFGICLDQVKGYLSSIAKWTCEEARARISEGVANPYPESWFSDPSAWKVELHSNKTVPRQENGYDCGIFALAALRSIALGYQFDYSQKDMGFFRMRIALDVLDDPPNKSLT
jgi:Ulp1 protease family, C-terminal catalytic domain